MRRHQAEPGRREQVGQADLGGIGHVRRDRAAALGGKAEELDLAAVQGTWERKAAPEAYGDVRRATKEINGSHEMVTFYDAAGAVLRAEGSRTKRTGVNALSPADRLMCCRSSTVRNR